MRIKHEFLAAWHKWLFGVYRRKWVNVKNRIGILKTEHGDERVDELRESEETLIRIESKQDEHYDKWILYKELSRG